METINGYTPSALQRRRQHTTRTRIARIHAATVRPVVRSVQGNARSVAFDQAEDK